MYAFFWPDREAMDHLSTLLEEGRVIQNLSYLIV